MLKGVKKSPLKYMGGKSYIAEWIVSQLPKHHCYVEVFGGGASVLFVKPESPTEVYNDLWGDVVNFFLVLRDRVDELMEYLRYTPYSRQYHDIALEKFKNRDFRDDIERAGITFFLLHSGVNGIIGGGFSSGPSKNNASALKTSVDSLKIFAERFRRVIIENLDFEEVIKKYDDEDTLFYCDPPYLGVERAREYYLPKFEYRDHYRLSKVLRKIDGKFVLSYYSNPYVEDLYPRDEFIYLEKEVIKRSVFAKGDKKKPKAKEILILNYEPKQQNFRIMNLREVFRSGMGDNKIQIYEVEAEDEEEAKEIVESELVNPIFEEVIVNE